MAIITTGQTFTATGPVTNTKLQDIASAATFNDPVDETSLELIPTGSNVGKLGVKDAGITPAKLSAGGPEWDASGALLSSNVTAPESANSLLLRSDPESPGTGADGGSQIRLFSSDSSFPDQINHKGDYHLFNNIAGEVQGSIPYAETPTLPQHFVRKDYVDGGGGFTPSTYTGGESVRLPNGLIMKFGIVTVAANTNTTVTFDTNLDVFSGTVNAQLTIIQDSTADLYSVKVGSLSNTELVIRTTQTGTPQVYWQVIGY
jgi:hypothetical protein|tara:strand:- start:526 stop:1305 length:780 start_codon:yes stop_codon:yes gene_type:complete